MLLSFHQVQAPIIAPKAEATSVRTRSLAWTAVRRLAPTLARDQAVVRVAIGNIAWTRGNEAAAEAKLRLDEVTLSCTTLWSPFSRVISVREAALGEFAGPGVAIVTLNDLDHPRLPGHVEEQDLGGVRSGKAADLTTDTYRGKIYRGRISTVSADAQFAPETVERHAAGMTLVYRTCLDVENPTHELLPGVPLLPVGR